MAKERDVEQYEKILGVRRKSNLQANWGRYAKHLAQTARRAKLENPEQISEDVAMRMQQLYNAKKKGLISPVKYRREWNRVRDFIAEEFHIELKAGRGHYPILLG